MRWSLSLLFFFSSLLCLPACKSEAPGDAPPPSQPPSDRADPAPSLFAPLACGDAPGTTLSGTVTRRSLKGEPPAPGTENIAVPCPGATDCAASPLLVLLCRDAECAAETDPVAVHEVTDGDAFAFCAEQPGSLHLLPLLDHDADGTLSPGDWTQGITSITRDDVEGPARVRSTEVDLSAGAPPSIELAINFFHQPLASPLWRRDQGTLHLLSTLDAAQGMGLRSIDLSTQRERDHDTQQPGVQAHRFKDPSAPDQPLEAPLRKLAFHDHVAYFTADTHPSFIFRARLRDDASIERLPPLDLRRGGRALGLDLPAAGEVVTASDGTHHLVLITRERGGQRPQRPRNPLLIVSIPEETGDEAMSIRALDLSSHPDLEGVRFDAIAVYGDRVFVSESSAGSRALATSNLTRLWTLRVGVAGTPSALSAHEGPAHLSPPFRPDACPDPRAPYRGAGVWAGRIQGTLYAALGGWHGVTFWRLDGAQLERLSTLSLNEHARGFSRLQPTRDGRHLVAVGDCSARVSSVFGDGEYARARRRLVMLNLQHTEAGLPTLFTGYDDTTTAPDIVRDTTGDRERAQGRVAGPELDCRALTAQLLQTYGATNKNIAEHLPDRDCVRAQFRDLVVTDHHVFLAGAGTPSHRQTGLGVASELWVIDLESGHTVLRPGWRWLYDGDRFKRDRGAFGVDVGAGVVNVIEALFWVR